MLAGAHKKFYRIQHPGIYLLDQQVGNLSSLTKQSRAERSTLTGPALER